MLPGCPTPRPPSYTGRGCLSAPYRRRKISWRPPGKQQKCHSAEMQSVSQGCHVLYSFACARASLFLSAKEPLLAATWQTTSRDILFWVSCCSSFCSGTKTSDTSRIFFFIKQTYGLQHWLKLHGVSVSWSAAPIPMLHRQMCARMYCHDVGVVTAAVQAPKLMTQGQISTEYVMSATMNEAFD